MEIEGSWHFVFKLGVRTDVGPEYEISGLGRFTMKT